MDPGHTIPALLEKHARDRPSDTFLVFEDDAGSVVARTYEETLERTRRTAATLRARGVRAGDRVHVHLSNQPGFLDCWFGAATLGAVIVPTNPLLTAAELGYVVSHARCRLSVTERDLYAVVESVRNKESIVVDDELDAGEGLGQSSLPRPLDVAAVLYTSGTTSRPKGVLVTHANYVHAGEVVAQHLELRREDRWLVVLPLFHANAQYYSTMSALTVGASVAVMSRFSASKWSAQARAHGATVASLFAAPIRMILSSPRTAEDGNNELRAVVFSQNVTEGQVAEFEDRFGTPLLQLYGMTETIAPPTLNPLHGERRTMSIGLPTAGSRLRIVDGELHVHGEPGVTLMAGYLDDPGGTSAAFQDGWLHTGDNVRIDDDGYYYFVDRTKDMIKRAGENVAASEVEAVANEHPGVYESAAIGVPDPMRDEAIRLFVVARDGMRPAEDDLMAWCAERLAKFKVPSFIEFVDRLPRTPVGKIQKERLRQRGGDH
jgi:crotonobetaine/carnitine-CoA ligase